MINSKIIKIASNTKFVGLKNIFTHKSSIKNFICGDKIKLELLVGKNKLNYMRYETESCILCEASASLLANKLKGYPLAYLKKDLKFLKENITEKNQNIPKKFKEFKLLLNKNNKNRLNCILLPLDGVLRAFKK